MFSKKSKTPFQVVVLTSDYLIEGENNPADENDIFNDGVKFNFGNAHESGNLYGGIALQSVKISPTRFAGEIMKFNKWMIGGADTVLAIIPMDTNALTACKDVFKDFSAIGDGVVLAGTHTIRGTILTEDNEKNKAILSDTGFFMIENGIITNLANDKLKDIKSELIVVNGRFIDGYNVE